MNEKKAYNQLDHSGTYRQDEKSVALTVLGGTYGGGSEVLIVEEIDEVNAISFQERAGCAGGGKGILIQKERVGALSTLCNQYVYENHQQDGRIKSMGEINETISQKYGTGGNNTPIVVKEGGTDVAETIDASYYKGAGPRNGKERQYVVEEGGNRTLGRDRASYNQGANAQFGFSIEEEKIGAQTAKGPGAVCERVTSIVRRLTPVECELLQGFPRGWTDIGDWTDSKGKVHKGDSDAPRYKALGNSIAVGFTNNGSGFWMWLMKRISAQYERNATLGSLFDGISGFPLAWAKYNSPENCRWSSEIEEFPIAVCKKHFGDEDNGIEGDIRKYL